ncbi:flagellar biosynthetic protein FliO [Legionella micdadei]|uniref:Flagellar protein n=1 Tax=Legionella micdadei TaxID=451 RepID=A0A098GEK9_LEGMI|nr:flagellar biosynthetic protein FliO [Legionella micdadei]ARG97968.1 flagellar biosynthetic protein FliO [Legionella micdadei]ARG99713.1 flagellar biosynthetic protein FliO [Legionella micdadei]KTD30235.1 flagellar protein fliO [Legionella micdadei]NSL19223.1 flagellar biosynthetic protein FliO [Legionella micdadei]CEG60410.1 Flagellar assembly protein FliO [Legionella micdadei]
MKLTFLGSIGLLVGNLLPIISRATTLSTHNSPALSSSELMRVLGGLLIVVAVIVLLSWILRRLNGAKFANASGFKIIACMNLGAREKIMLVQVGSRILLLGVTSGSINTLHDFGEELPPSFSSEPKPSFSEFLKTALGKSE